jgi:hypothetical protein
MTEALRVLIACESSGKTRDAFLALGHDAISCDLLPTTSPGPHHEGDVREILDDGFDLMIAHPDCTYLTNSAEWAYKDVQTKNIKPGTLIGAARRAARDEAVAFVKLLWDAPIEKKVIENPVGALSRLWMKPTQYIQPYQFNEDASKKTCLWIDGLQLLKPTGFFEPRYVCCGMVLDVDNVGKYGCANCCGERTPLPRWGNQTDSGQNRLGPSEDRWSIRSQTYDGWANAFALQWGGQVK